ncbi:MAG: response regulator, partial [Candidatus Adiutrix sp.]
IADAASFNILFFDKSKAVRDSLAYTFDNLGLPAVICHSEKHFLGLLSASHNFTHILIPYEMMSELKVHALAPHCALVIIAEYSHSVLDTPAMVLRKPITCLHIAGLISNDAGPNGYRQGDDADVSFTAPSAHVLFVDDNAINLKVATGLVASYKMNVDTASSGLEAINKVMSKKYDLVFMDHMMPEMDGIEATIAIRQIPGDYFADLPIVALTANAVSGAKAEFLAAGMTDFLSKPIEMHKFNAILKEYIPKDKRISNTFAPYGPSGGTLRANGDSPHEASAHGALGRVTAGGNLPAPTGTPLKEGFSLNDKLAVEAKAANFEIVQIEGLDMKEGLENCGGDYDVFWGALEVFYDEGLKQVSLLPELLAEGDHKGFLIQIHTLKSTCATVGAGQQSALALDLEEASRRGDTQYVADNLAKFLTSFEGLLMGIKPALEAKKQVS